MKQAQQQREAGRLGGDAQVGSDGGGRAFVHVRRPLVERHQRDLEEQAGGDGGDRQEDEDLAGAVHSLLERGAQHVEIGARQHQGHAHRPANVGHRADAVEQREAVGQQAGAERAQQQILHGGFVGAALAAQEARQDVEADGHGLEAQELDDQVVAGGHEHHADGGEQQQRVVFAVMLVFDLQVAHREQNHQRQRDQENHAEEDEERVHHDGTGEAADRVRAELAVQPVQRDAAEEHAHHGEERVAGLVAHAQHEVEDQDGQPNRASSTCGRIRKKSCESVSIGLV